MATIIAGEAALLRQSVEALRRIDFVREARLTQGPRGGPAGQLRLKGAWGSATFEVDAQPKVVEAALPSLAHRRANEPDRRFLLVTSYVPPALAEQLQQRHIEFLDTAGNAYVERPVYLFVSGRRPAHKPTRLNRAFRPAGLRLLYVFLKNPAFLAATQREMASVAGVALGSVPIILDDLRQRGYLRRMEAGRQGLANARELLFRWEQGYGELLRPKLLLRTCRLAGSRAGIDDLIPWLRQRTGVLLGGELGAAALTQHLRAESAALHIAEDEKAVMSSLRLIPDPQGNITLLRIFGGQNARDEEPKEPPLADPLLIHAELAQMTSERIQETAKRLLDEHILPRLA